MELMDKIKKHEELIKYGFWGCITVLFTIVSYTILSYYFDYKVANLISIILTKVFAYFTNKMFVFKSKASGSEQITEIIKFAITRGITGVIEWSGMIFLVEVLSIDDFAAKIGMIFIITILNYLFAKFSVFKKTDRIE